MVLEDQPAAVEEEESDDEAIDMEVCTTLLSVKTDVFLYFCFGLLLGKCLNASLLRILSRVESLKRTLGWWSPLSRF